MESKNTFFLIDDDQGNIATLNKVISKVFPNSPISVTDDPRELLQKLKNGNHKSVVISNSNIRSVNASQLLTKIREENAFKDSYFIVITDKGSEENLKALKMGADDYISKPFTVDQLISKLRNSVRHINMLYKLDDQKNKVKALKEELDNEAAKMKDMLIELHIARDKSSGKKLQRIVDASLWIANKFKQFDYKELEVIENAASLCYLGKLILPDNLLNTPVMKDGNPTNDHMAALPGFMKKNVEKIHGYQDVALNLYHVFENFDGSGIPEKKQSWQIPIGSRIIRVAHDFEEYYSSSNLNEGKAMDELYHQSKRLYDFKIVSLYDQYLANLPQNQTRERSVEVKDLVEGMILSRNIITDSGLRLMSSGLEMKIENIEKIREIRKSDPIIGSIYVRRKK